MRDRPARILFADDDEAALLVAQAALQASGYEVACAGDGERAVSLFSEWQPDCLVLDIMMPGRNGYQVCEAIRAQAAGRDVPILILTSRDDVEAISRAYDSGATDFATKGISSRLLVERVRFLLREHEARRAVVISRSRLHLVQNMARVGHWEVDADGRSRHMSGLVQSFLDVKAGAPAHFGQLVSALRTADRTRALAAFRAWQEEATPMRLQVQLRNGTHLHIQGTTTPGGDGNGGRTLTIAVQDITALRQAQKRAHRLANFDTLTGLPNRLRLLDSIAEQLRSRDPALQLAILCFRLNGLERLQQSFGQPACDAASVLSAQVILAAIGQESTDAFAHLGNGEFVLCRPACDSPSAAVEIAEEVARAFAAPMTGKGWTANLQVSTGIAMWPADGEDSAALIEKARATAANGMSATSSSCNFFTADIHERARRVMTIESALHGALERGEMALVYQPRIRVQDCFILGTEALLRWQHPQLGALYPTEFIPIAEEAGMVGALGTWVLHEACRQTAQWRRETNQGLTVSVNVSAHQLRAPRKLVEDVRAALAESGLPSGALELELTESVFINLTDDVHKVLAQLRGLGVSIALDDFGTGYSSLSYLRQVKVDCLKIDRKFVSDLSRDDEAERMLMAMLGIASALRLRTVAEGVETMPQFDMLRRHACVEAQGFLFARPLAPQALRKLISQSMSIQLSPESPVAVA